MVETGKFDSTEMAAYREQARARLAEMTEQVKRALEEASIEIDVFIVVPATGSDVIATFGTVADPADAVWERVSEIVCSIVRQAVGLERVRLRDLTCATTAGRYSVDPANGVSETESIPSAILKPTPPVAVEAKLR